MDGEFLSFPGVKSSINAGFEIIPGFLKPLNVRGV
jgi:hypothetical protein